MKENARKCPFLYHSLDTSIRIAVAQKDRRYWRYWRNGQNNGGKPAEHSPTSISEAVRTFLTFLSSLPEFKSHSEGLGHRQGHRLGLRADRVINRQRSCAEEKELHLKKQEVTAEGRWFSHTHLFWREGRKTSDLLDNLFMWLEDTWPFGQS